MLRPYLIYTASYLSFLKSKLNSDHYYKKRLLHFKILLKIMIACNEIPLRLVYDLYFTTAFILNFLRYLNDYFLSDSTKSITYAPT